MSIRYRLLLVVGLLVTAVFSLAFILNNQLLSRNLVAIKAEAQGFIESNLEKRRDNVEKFIFDNMARKLARINAILETISQFSSLSDWFAPSAENLKLGTWSHAAHFLQDEDWIQFLQNTSDSKLLSLIAPEEGPFFQTKAVPLEEGLAWVFVSKAAAYPDPYLGIELPFKPKEEPLTEDSSLVVSESLPTVYALYTIEHLQSISVSSDFLQNKGQAIQEPSVQGYEIDEDRFYDFLMKARELAKNPSFAPPGHEQMKFPKQEEDFTRSHTYLKQILDYSYELFLLGEITALQRAHLFGAPGETIDWPSALSFSKQGIDEGNVFFLDPIIGFSKPFFDDEAFFKKYPPKPGSFVSSGSVVIKSPHPNQAFFVNTAAFYSQVGDQKKQSLLTIGFDMTDFLQDLVTISGLYGCMVSDNNILTEITPKGFPPVHFELIPALVAGEKLKGFFHLGDTEYFFLKSKPDPDINFYLCFFLPKQEFFSVFLKVQENIKTILYHVWMQRFALGLCSLIILWIFLLDLSKKITKPIIALSNSLRYVKSGEWDLIKIPPIPSQNNKEIKQLLTSFQDMVEGMKEKEKMSGVLNKVVSKEIAQEILKGDVHLGGEEREVTMLFVDIRGFTKLTQNMEPQEIIQLLNMCMTKLSQVIEENKGVIDKYLGDGIMALYGAPISYKESALSAVVSGMEMISIIQKWDEERIKSGQPPLNIGIGIHTGTVCAGNMGALNRLNYTVIGSHVNMASRLCYAAGPGELLITADTYLQSSVQQNVEVEDKGFMAFKGFDEKKQVYRVLGLKNRDIGKFLVLEGTE
jgi:class 3 adenylate cyclase/uncharacterized protein YozE (UPF0346 family)